MAGSELVSVDFHEDSILATKGPAGTILVGVKRICESLGLGYESQLQKLKGTAWACISNIVMHDTIGRLQETCVIPVDRLPMWLATIRVHKVRVDLRPKLTAYQIEAVAVLARHFLGTPVPPAVPKPRPWHERLTETWTPHHRYLQIHHPGYFTVVDALFVQFMDIEDELVRHLLDPKPSDRPDVSVGLMWAKDRRRRGLPDATQFAPVYLPDVKREVQAAIYPYDERGELDAWFHRDYLPDHLPKYLTEKPSLRRHGVMPPVQHG